MFWFRKAKPPPPDEQLAGTVRQLQSEVRALQGEFDELHNRVHRWMRRAVAAESAVDRRSSLLPSASPGASSQLLAGRAPRLWGARRRIAAREARRAQVEQLTTGADDELDDSPAENGNGSAPTREG